MRICRCGQAAAVYAMDTCAGGWADYFCLGCLPPRWQVTDRLDP